MAVTTRSGHPRWERWDSVTSFEIDDLKTFFNANLSPSVATFHVAGDVSEERVLDALSGLAERWEAREVARPDQPTPPEIEGQTVYFVDVPGAKQSVLRVGRLALSAADPDATRLGYANARLGGGSSGRLFQLLRIEKGYTYGAYSGISDTIEVAPFSAVTSVRANVTLESLQLLRDQIRDYATTFTLADVDISKNQIVKGKTRAFESLAAKLSLLRRMSRLELPPDFVEREQDELLAMTLEDFREVITTYLDESQMIYLVVGDAETQLPRMAELNYGEPVLLNIHGRIVD